MYIKITEISGLSVFEYVSLIGHYNKVTLTPQVDPRLLTRGYSESALDEMRAKMSKLPSEVLSLDVYFKNGIESCSVDYFGYALILFDSYSKHGILPYQGSLSDQPNKIIEIFQVLEQLTHEREQSFREKQEKENAKNNRKSR